MTMLHYLGFFRTLNFLPLAQALSNGKFTSVSTALNTSVHTGFSTYLLYCARLHRLLSSARWEKSSKSQETRSTASVSRSSSTTPRHNSQTRTTSSWAPFLSRPTSLSRTTRLIRSPGLSFGTDRCPETGLRRSRLVWAFRTAILLPCCRRLRTRSG